MRAAELLDDHRLAVVGGAAKKQVRHPCSLREGEQILHGGERRFGLRVGDPSIAANAVNPGLVALLRGRSHRGMQVPILLAHDHSLKGSIRSHGCSALVTSSFSTPTSLLPG